MDSAGAWVVLGAGGHATSVAAILHRLGAQVAGHSDPAGTARFASDAAALRWAHAQQACAVPAVGDAAVRAVMIAAARDAGVGLTPVIAASAVIAAGAALGDATVVGETAVIGPDTVIGCGAIVNTAAVIEHHVRVGELTHVGPRAVLLGAAVVGGRCLVGAGAIVLPGRRVGDGATVGAGAVVTLDVAPGATVVGVPARPVRGGAT